MLFTSSATMETYRATGYDNYWHLDPVGRRRKPELLEFLGKHGYPNKARFTISMLDPYAMRIARCQPCYFKCTDSELEKFFQDRTINLSSTKPVGREAHITTLTQLDREQQFGRFIDLPPELRNAIYEYYMADFPRRLTAPTQPPLTRTCRLMRSEALPIFYHQTSFVVDLGTYPDRLRLHPNATSFVSGLSETNCAWIRSLHFVVHKDRDTLATGRRTKTEVTVRLNDDKGYHLKLDRSVNRGPPLTKLQAGRKVEGIKETVKVAMRKLVARDDKARFRVQDIFVLRSAIEKGYL